MRPIILVVVAACGGGGGAPVGDLDCAYLAASDNCWKTTTSAAASCLPAAGATGVLAADNASCTYATGQVIAFAAPLPLPLPNNFNWSFAITTNGQPCVDYEKTSDGGFVLTVGADTVSESISSADGLALTCPDGSERANATPLALLNCPGNFGGLPGNETSSGSTSVHFELINSGVDSLTLFDCSR